MAEPAVNQVVSLRMAKKRQMRWSEEGAHALAQVRVADLNGELSPKTFGYLRRNDTFSYHRKSRVTRADRSVLLP